MGGCGEQCRDSGTASPESPLYIRKRTGLVQLLSDQLKNVSLQYFTEGAQQGNWPTAGADLGFLEWWGCNSNAREKYLGHAHLIKTTSISITSRYLALSLPSRHSDKCKTSGFTTASLFYNSFRT